MSTNCVKVVAEVERNMTWNREVEALHGPFPLGIHVIVDGTEAELLSITSGIIICNPPYRTQCLLHDYCRPAA